jgi:hypothetical protein
MSRTMLTYTKSVLKRVSFDSRLFCKELQKACKVLLPHELEKLMAWLVKYTEKRPDLQHCILLIK